MGFKYYFFLEGIISKTDKLIPMPHKPEYKIKTDNTEQTRLNLKY